MKALGIVRRIDELGRIVIPIEIRRNMRVRSGDEMEMFINDNADIVIRRYTRIRNMEDKLATYLDALQSKNYDCILITSVTNIIASSCRNENDLNGSFISMELVEQLNTRSTKLLTYNSIPLFIGDSSEYHSQIVVPIIAGGDLYGGLIVCANTELTNTDKELLQIISNLIINELL